MLRNYFIIALRVFKNQPTYTFINVIGLGIGIACCLVTFVFLNHELSFDSFHEKKDNIYKIVTAYKTDQGDISHGSRTPYPMATAIKNDLPNVGKVIEIQGPYENQISFTDLKGNFHIFKVPMTLYSNEHFLSSFSFKIKRGAPGSILKEPHKVYVTEKAARKFFGDEDPIGKTLKIQEDSISAEVVGILENPPLNNSLPFEVVVSYETFRNRFKSIHTNNWSMHWMGYTYLEIPENQNTTTVAESLNAMLPKYVGDEEAAKNQLGLQSITDIHTDDKYGNNTHYTIPREIIFALVVLAALLIGTACLNFINLATAQAVKRSKEIGIRKTIGGNKKQLRIQFLMETLFIVLIATVIALTIAQIFLFSLNAYLQQYTVYNLEFTIEVVWFLIPVVVLVTFLAGLYPSMIVSSYEPVVALQNKINSKKGAGNYFLRKFLVVTQYCFAIMMLVTMIIISDQIKYLNDSDMGFNRERVVHLRMPTNSKVSEKVELLKDKLLQLNFVESASTSFGPPIGGMGWNSSFKRQEAPDYEDGMNASIKFVDEDYLSTYEIPMSSGNALNPKEINDSTFHVLVNKRFLQKIGFTEEEAIGKRFQFNGNMYAIIDGVTEDFNTWSLKVNMHPVVLAYRPDYFSGIDVRISGKDFYEVQAQIEETYRSVFPNDLFDFIIPEDAIQDSYALENFVFRVIMIFSVMSIFISVIGLYGLVSFMVSRNKKMIGVRKVFGASTSSILKIFIKEYLLLLGIAFLLASPVAYWIGENFLESFVYRISVSPVHFLGAFSIVFVIAMVTVGWKSYQSASQNPAHSLRYE